jgi:cytoskeleton protein RodZ
MADNERPVDDGDLTASPEDTLGAILRSAREAQQLTLEEISGELRIALYHLDALEENRFEVLGPPVFAKGYLKQYGRRLGLDYGALLARYERQANAEEVLITPVRPIRLRDERQVGLWIGALLALVLLAAAIAVWWWSGSPPAMSVGAVVAPPPAAGVSELAEPEAGAPPAPPVRAESAATPAAEPEPAPEHAAATAEPEQAFVPATTPAAQQLAVRLMFDQDCWTEVTDAAGQQLYYGLARAGTELELAGVAPLRVFFGNVDGARVEVAGAPYPVPTRARRGNLATFSISRPER